MKNKRILIVEDEAIVAMDLEQTLVNLGFIAVGNANSFDSALEKVKSTSPDLILMDIHIKGAKDGIDAATKVKEMYDIPVVFLTAHADEATLDRAKETSPFGYVVKPFDKSNLKATIEIALSKFDEKQSQTGIKTLDDVDQCKKTKLVLSNAKDLFDVLEPFCRLPEKELKALTDVSVTKTFIPQSFVTYEGSLDKHVFLVLSGRLLLLKTSANGKELIVDLVPPADLLPITYALQQKEQSLTVKAQIESKVIFVPMEKIVKVFDNFPQMYKELSETMSAKLRESLDITRQLAHEKVEVRVAAALLRLRGRLEKYSEENKFEINLTRKELADLTGTTPETASRVSNALENDGLLDLTVPGKMIVKDVLGLESIVEE